LIALAQHPNIVATKLTCANVGKGIRVSSKFTPQQFSVFGGSSDFLFPTLEAGGSGCVAALGNVFPRSTSKLYNLWASGKKEEARKLQDIVANAEWACKKGVALTKYGASHFVGPKIGVEKEAFYPRRPYLPPTEKSQAWTVEIMGVLLEEEEATPERKL
jgi:4-hydroxy-2-oxoglutarate aldolase